MSLLIENLECLNKNITSLKLIRKTLLLKIFDNDEVEDVKKLELYLEFKDEFDEVPALIEFIIEEIE